MKMIESSKSTNRATWNSSTVLVIGVSAVVFFFGALGSWSVRANIAGAVVVSGILQASSVKQVVQHRYGGIVSNIHVKDGDEVSVGDVLLNLDDRKLLSDLSVVESDLFEVLVDQARLQADIKGKDDLIASDLLIDILNRRPEFAEIYQSQVEQLRSSNSLYHQKSVLVANQRKNILNQTNSLQSQLAVKKSKHGIILEELENEQYNFANGLVSRAGSLQLAKDKVNSQIEMHVLDSRMLELSSQLTALDIELLNMPIEKYRNSILAYSKSKASEIRLQEQFRKLKDETDDLAIRAPISGTVHDMRVQGLRSVIGASAPILTIILDQEPNLAIVQLKPSDVDQVSIGQVAALKFSAFNRRSSPSIEGFVSHISADTFADSTNSQAYYRVEVSITDVTQEVVDSLVLAPGMPVEVFISTSSHTPLQYILKPLVSYFDKALKDT